MKKSFVPVLLFGSLLAVLMLLLHFFEYRYYIGSLDNDVYTSVVATLFTAIGIWIGINGLKSKKASPKDAPVAVPSIDQKKLQEFQLNDREYEILQLIAKGCSNQEIANQLFLAVPTIKTHISNLYSKLDVRSRTQAIHKAQSLHLI